MTNNCQEHQRHATKREALDHLRWAKKQPRGKGLRHLKVYHCDDCNGWHVGRSWRTQRERELLQPKAPEPKKPKPPSAGKLRREQEQQKKKYGRKARHLFSIAGYFTDAAEAAARLEYARKDFQDSIRIANEMAARITFEKNS
jgi:hypothetical protein